MFDTGRCMDRGSPSVVWRSASRASARRVRALDKGWTSARPGRAVRNVHGAPRAAPLFDFSATASAGRSRRASSGWATTRRHRADPRSGRAHGSGARRGLPALERSATGRRERDRCRDEQWRRWHDSCARPTSIACSSPALHAARPQRGRRAAAAVRGVRLRSARSRRVQQRILADGARSTTGRPLPKRSRVRRSSQPSATLGRSLKAAALQFRCAIRVTSVVVGCRSQAESTKSPALRAADPDGLWAELAA